MCATSNNLSKAVVEATSIDMFKGRLDNYLRLNLEMKLGDLNKLYCSLIPGEPLVQVCLVQT